MAYDPCGTQRLDGDVILKRIAAYLKVDVKDLENELKTKCEVSKALREFNGSVSD